MANIVEEHRKEELAEVEIAREGAQHPQNRGDAARGDGRHPFLPWTGKRFRAS